jgi:hypothetical protein
LTETWNEKFDFVLTEGGYFEIALYDVDAASVDLIAGWGWAGSDSLIGLVRNYGEKNEVASGSVSVKYRVNPDL